MLPGTTPGGRCPPQAPPTHPGLLRGVLSVSSSRPGLQHCGSCAASCGQGRGLGQALWCRSALCQQLGSTQARHRPAPHGPATRRMVLSPRVSHGGGAGCWHVLMFPPTSRVITSHELSRGNEAGAACCQAKLWCQQGAGQSLQLPAPNAPGSARLTSQLRSGTPICFSLAVVIQASAKIRNRSMAAAATEGTQKGLSSLLPLFLFTERTGSKAAPGTPSTVSVQGPVAGGTSSPCCCWGPAGQPPALPPPFCASTPRAGTALWDKSCASDLGLKASPHALGK